MWLAAIARDMHSHLHRAASQIAVSGPAVADRSAVHHFEAKTGASPCRIFFFMPDKMCPGTLMTRCELSIGCPSGPDRGS
jgi:hypothetical protein